MLIVVEKQNAGFLGLILVEWDWLIRTAERHCPLAFSFVMAQHTPPRPDEHINMELAESAIDDTGAQSAAAAAAAALVALPQAAAAAAADAGQWIVDIVLCSSLFQPRHAANRCSCMHCFLLCRCPECARVCCRATHRLVRHTNL